MTLSQPPTASDRFVTGRRAPRRPNVTALLLAGVGVALVALAYTVLDWFRAETDGSFPVSGSSHFGDVLSLVTHAEEQTRGIVGAAPVARVYFSWFAWVLFAVVVACTALACLPNRFSTVAGLVGIVLAAAAIGLTFSALQLIEVRDDAYAPFGLNYGDYFGHAQLGFWFTVAGYLLLGAAALVGPPRKPKPPHI